MHSQKFSAEKGGDHRCKNDKGRTLSGKSRVEVEFHQKLPGYIDEDFGNTDGFHEHGKLVRVNFVVFTRPDGEGCIVSFWGTG